MPHTVLVGDVVRLYDDDEWAAHGVEGYFFEGKVVEIEDGYALVDFADWTARWPLAGLPAHWLGYSRVLLPHHPGEVVEDFRNPSCAA